MELGSYYEKIRIDFNREANDPQGMFSRNLTDADWAIVSYLQKIIKPEWKILDVGAGMGNVIDQLPFGKKTALDMSEDMIKNCRSKKVIGNMDKLPFQDKSFDLVYASFTIQQSKNPKKTIKELERVGKMVILFDGDMESYEGKRRQRQIEEGTWKTCGNAKWFTKKFFNKLGYGTDNLLPHVLVAKKQI